MARAPNLRQIEAFKAVIETGTVSRARLRELGLTGGEATGGDGG